MEKFSPPTHYFADEPVPGTEDWQHIASAEANIAYEWDEFHVWYSPSERQYFWIYGSGCSCNDLSDLIETKESFENGSRDDALRALKREGDDEWSSIPKAAIRACRDKIRQFKEPA